MAAIEGDAPRKTISVAALKLECGPHIGDHVVRKIKSSGNRRVPDLDQLQVGDIILSRPRNKSGVPQNSIVTAYQEEIAGFSREDAYWSHAMVYVGNLHVVESQKIYAVQKYLKYSTGTRVQSLVDYAQNHDLIVCRYSELNGYLDVQANIARYALLDQAVNRRRYSYGRLIEMMREDQDLPKRPEFGRAVICSEYALECLAIGGQCMSEEFNGIGTNRRFFFPADFHKSVRFEKFRLETLELVD